MKSLIIFSLVSILIYNENLPAQNGWFQIQTGTNINIKSIKFVNSQTGFVCSENGRIFKTTDGGFSWQLKYDDANTPLRSLYFINENTGWAGGGRYSFDFSYLVILKTIDGGKNWTTVYNFTNFYYTISQLFFLNNQTGFATSFGGTGSGTVGLILKTTNGGSNWNWINTSGTTSYNSIDFINDQTGFITGKLFDDTGGDTGYIFKTINSGINWNVSYQKERSTFNSVSFPTAEKGFVSGAINFNRPVILNTSDIGNLWKIDSSFSGFTLFETAFPSVNTGYVISSNSVFKTSNSGANWSQQNVTFNTFNSLFFLNDNTGWIGGNNGMVFKTYTGGEILPVDTVSPKYFPLKVGNKWVYSVSDFFNPDFERIVVKIVGEEINNGKKYFVLNTSPQFYWAIDKIRIDSLNGNLYAYDQNYNACGSIFERVIDSLRSDSGNVITYCEPYFGFSTCLNVDTVTLFGIPTDSKYFEQTSIVTLRRYYAKNIGIFYGYLGHYPLDWTTYVLKGCEIDGVVYGDTSTIVTYSISGTVRNAYTNQLITNGSVKAVKYDPVGDSLITVSVTNINTNGTYTLTEIPSDSVDIMAYQDDQLDFIPTYHPSTIYWEQSVTLYPTDSLSNININVYPITNSSGSLHNLSGHVYKNISETNSLKDAYVYVKNGNDYYNADMTIQNGSFSMGNVPSGNHNIIVNRIGYSTATRNLFVNDNIDTLKFYLDKVSSITTVSQIIPDEFKLHQNYPNPFNPKTNMKFDISKKSTVEFRIYDVSGKLLITIGKNEYNAGSYNLELDMTEYSSGIYFVNLITGDFSQTKKIVLLK